MLSFGGNLRVSNETVTNRLNTHSMQHSHYRSATLDSSEYGLRLLEGPGCHTQVFQKHLQATATSDFE